MSLPAGRSLAAHLGRGAGAAILLALAGWLLSAPGGLRGGGAVAAVAGAAVLLRGCPMCWLAGLIETIARPTRKEHAHDRGRPRRRLPGTV